MPVAADQISKHEVAVFEVLEKAGGSWLTCGNIAGRAPQVARRTVRAHLTSFVRRGLVDRHDVFPGPTYRLDPKAEQKCPAFVARLREAAERLGQTAASEMLRAS